MEPLDINEIFLKITACISQNHQDNAWGVRKEESLEVLVVYRIFREDEKNFIERKAPIARNDLSFDLSNPIDYDIYENGQHDLDPDTDDMFDTVVKIEPVNGGDNTEQKFRHSNEEHSADLFENFDDVYDSPRSRRKARLKRKATRIQSSTKSKKAKRKALISETAKKRQAKYPPLSQDEEGRYQCPNCPYAHESEGAALLHLSECKSKRKLAQAVHCEHCGLMFDSSKEHKFHCDLAHPDGTGDYACTKCEMKYVHRISLKRHMLTHRSPKAKTPSASVCKFCDGVFTGLKERTKHMVERHKDQVFFCTLCPTMLETDQLMVKHVKVKHRDAHLLISCSHCQREFYSQKSFLYHMDEKHEDKDVDVEKNFVCDIVHCQRRFRMREFLDAHARHHDVHSRRQSTVIAKKMALEQGGDQEKSPCPKCGKLVFTSEMQTHLNSHVKSVAKKCEDCGIVCASASKLRIHRLTQHVKIELYCPIESCGKVFHRRDVLKAHIDGVHGERTSHKCDQCDKSFQYRNDLQIHVRGVHEGKMSYCSVCNKAYVRPSEKNRHERQVHNITTSGRWPRTKMQMIEYENNVTPDPETL